MSDDAKEAQYKAQVANLHAKLTQAGSHLKNLAQDNARLKAQLAELESKPAQPTMDSHINELVSLMERAVFHEKEVPDVSTHDQLREYLQSIQQRLDNREARADQERKDAESKIESLKQQIQELKHTSETDQDGRDKLEEAKTKIETLTKRIEELETAQTNP
ncbi:hypothetical protein BCR43DRAFT_66527 [Syncephalastrum racemosum]|uniref:Uncharacterized protein n=1 Tax=Syncephalastrum racemosum TaxID=13706 RepID=A0A1X2HWE1_SYNRA|nr:hypothetical protein BCR43DRAFT_66527 [Syncephalastrum racemosum]